MHGFIVAHDSGCRRLSGTEERWPFGLANREVDELDATPLSLGTLRPDCLQDVLTTLAQS
jgi:hypothetical protein